MYDDDQDALAAEYVLGTLGRDEREQAAALLAIDTGFAAVVRSWERRLGELNVMVEAVEPPPRTWEKIKAAVTGVEPSNEIQLPLIEPVSAAAAAVAPEVSPAPPEASPAPPAVAPAPAPSIAARPERSADVIYLTRRVRRWRRMTLVMGTLAAVLALVVALPVFAPDLIPAQWQLPRLLQIARAPTGGTPAGPMVAMLQHDPGSPAFLLTVDPASRMLTVRRVAAAPEPNRSYELWLVSKSFPAPRSLGLVGIEEFTRRAIPANYDADTVNSATYAVSLEPSGGSPRGVPTGPVLFTGKLIESQPRPVPPRT
jgi:anti-sigma-K factor RskA